MAVDLLAELDRRIRMAKHEELPAMLGALVESEARVRLRLVEVELELRVSAARKATRPLQPRPAAQAPLPPVAAQEDRIVRDRERQSITGVCRSRWWKLERAGLAPGRVTLMPGSNRVGWRLSELVEWVNSRERHG